MNWLYGGYGRSREDKLANCRDKREKLVNQCRRKGIPATMGGKNERENRVKPTTISKMYKLLRQKGVEPCC